MKVLFYKAKHFWKDGENATWIKSERFDTHLFSELKQEYENIKYSKINYIEKEGITAFLFYETKKDFQDRPITEITALKSNKKIKNPEMVYRILSTKIDNVFDDTLKYEIEINDSYIKKIDWKLYIGGLIVVLLLGTYFFTNKEPSQLEYNNKEVPLVLAGQPAEANATQVQSSSGNEKSVQKKEKIAQLRKDQADQNKPRIQESGKEKTEPKKVTIEWKWEKFCDDRNNMKHQKSCFQDFIQEKCKAREKYGKSYLSFIEENKDNTLCINVEGLTDIDDDTDLKNADLNTEFFKGEKKNEKRKIQK